MRTEEGEEIDAAAGIEGEGGAGERRVDEIGVAGVVGGRVGAEIVESHGHAGKKAALGGAAHEDENVGVAGVLGNGVGELGDGGFFAFEALEEVAVFIEKHAGDAEDFVFGAGALEHDVDFGDVEVFGGGTDVDDAEHGGLRFHRRVYRGRRAAASDG